MKKLLTFLLILVFIVTPVQAAEPTSKYAALEILEPMRGMMMTSVGGHFYAIGRYVDEAEEVYVYGLYKDGKEIYTFDEKWCPRGIVQIKGTIYIALVESIVKYSNGKLTTVADDLPGYIYDMNSNGKDMTIICTAKPGRWGEYLEGTYHIVTTSGKVTQFGSSEVAIDYNYPGTSVNADGDRLARIPFGDNGIKTMRKDGTEYTQRLGDKLDYDEYVVTNIIYYNNCLIANVKGSLVYYDEKNKPHVIMGDMVDGKTDRIYVETWREQPYGALPIQSGTGDKVRIGYVSWWTIGDDGYIYGITVVDRKNLKAFRLKLPESVKKVTTYKKTK